MRDALLDEWHPVAASEELPQGRILPASLLDTELVLWRGAGGVHAWPDLCIHRGARLSLGRIAQNCLHCPYHGWIYSEDGRCLSIPAHPSLPPPRRAHVIPFRAAERYGVIWVSLGTPAGEPPLFPEWDDGSLAKTRCGPYRAQASAPRLIENFLDLAHLPIVHQGILGDPNRAAMPAYAVGRRLEGGWIAADIPVWQPDPDGSGRAQTVSYTYEILRPLTARFRKTGEGKRYGILASVHPIGSRESAFWMWNFWDPREGVTAEEIQAHQERVFAQDRPIVESQRPELLPLDLQAELHLASDRLAVTYRRWLSELGVGFGTS
ncbi:MAG: aromatic ring-hydroxylating dioxygenase subunit alpha [Methylacidiphilaceae bacterium]|nr:aromatic ring-hydroxylating dioxygenase subunit alpha [Candidatus Methylacidiphilaceae bacterium]